MKRPLLTGMLIFMALAFAASMARADGILVPGHWPPPHDVIVEPLPAFAIKYHHVKVDIEGQLAKTHIDQVFINQVNREIEGTYLFPIPEGAAIKDFKMWMNNEPIPGKVLDKDEARRIYEAIVRQRKDPGLLEYVDRGLFRASVFPIPANGEQRIEIEYTEMLTKNNNTVPYTYPLNTERFSSKPINDVTISVNIHSKIPIKNVYSPTHTVSVRRPDNNTAAISYEEANTRPNIDFSIYYSLSEDDIGLSLLTWKPKGEDGYFMFLAAPPAEVQEKEVAAKDVVFVFDRTGSMSGDKIEQAREALKFSLRNLNAKDRFNVVTFNETPEPLFDKMQPATKANIDKALEMAGALTAVGGTNIDEALTKSAPMLTDKSRPSFILFLTDGLPTVGVTDVDQILADVQKAMPKFARVFVFGVGYDVNTFLLDKMAGNHNGVPEYVRPGEDLEVKVSALYRKISYPILANLEIDWGAMRPYDIFPGKLPDLFKGSQIILAGRFKGSGTAKVKLTGEAQGKKESFTLTQNLSDTMPLNDFIPTLWAQRKINFLLAEIRLKGHNKELVDEVIRLSKQFGIITEYTSFLVEEPGMVSSEEFEERALSSFDRAAAPKMKRESGGSAVNQSVNLAAGQSATTANIGVQGYYDEDGSMVSISQVQQAGDRVFFQQGRVWVENTYNDKMEVLKVKAFSEAQFQLLARDPSLGKYMSVGEEVIIMVNGQAVQIGAEGQDTLSDKDLKKLFGS